MIFSKASAIRFSQLGLLIFWLLLSILAVPAAALTDEQRNLFQAHIYPFDEARTECRTGGANTTVGPGFNLGTDPAERRVNLIRALMQAFDLSAGQAAGPVGNFMRESGGTDLPPDVNEGGHRGPPAFSGGYGWAQWTGSRQVSFIDFAVSNGFMESEHVNANDGANFAWLAQELNTSYQPTITALKALPPNDPRAAARSFEETFERARVPALEEREANAAQAFSEYNSQNGGGPTTGAASGGDSTSCGGGGGIVGDVAFPLGPTKSVVNNPGIFTNNTTSTGGHNYTAYDILADPGTDVRAFTSGKVSSLSRDRCGGRLIGIYNAQDDVVVTYMHNSYSNHVAIDQTVHPADHVAQVGDAALGCNTAHLHIDAIQGDVRAACSRLSCPDSVRDLFIDIGPDLYNTYQALPD